MGHRQPAFQGCEPDTVFLGQMIHASRGMQSLKISHRTDLDPTHVSVIDDIIRIRAVFIRQARFRNETYVSRALINPVIRGCPSCLRGDVTSELMPPQGQMAMQGHWQLRYVEVCGSAPTALGPSLERCRAFGEKRLRIAAPETRK